VICVECTTQFEGINRCAKCLGARLAKAKKLVARKDWSVGNVLLAMMSFGAIYGIAWVLSKVFT
jgi:hypothetical protein